MSKGADKGKVMPEGAGAADRAELETVFYNAVDKLEKIASDALAADEAGEDVNMREVSREIFKVARGVKKASQAILSTGKLFTEQEIWLRDFLQSEAFREKLRFEQERQPLVDEIIEKAGLTEITDELFNDEVWPIVPFVFAVAKRRKKTAPELTPESAPQLLEAIKAEGDLPGNPWADIVKRAKADREKAKGGYFLEDFLTLPHSTITDLIEYVGKSDFFYDALADTAKYTAPNGSELEIRDFGKLSGEIGVSARKLFDISRVKLAENNYYSGRENPGRIDPVVTISLDKYWTMCGYDVIPETGTAAELNRIKVRKSGLRDAMRKDLENISKIYISGVDKKKKGNTVYSGLHIISSFEVSNNIATIRFDIAAAEHLAKTYLMKYPAAALRIDNRRPNTYSLLFKIAEHSSIDANAREGTGNTLSVKSLLDAMPNLQSYDEMILSTSGESKSKKGNRNWKIRIKKPLESALDDLIEVGYLQKWEYRSPKGKSLQRFTKEQADGLSWAEFSSLMIDYIIINEPDQEERRQRNLERIVKAAQKKEEKEIRIEATRRNKAAAAIKKKEAEANS